MSVATLESLTPQSVKGFGPSPTERLRLLREQSWERFNATAWPTKTDEEWRRTDPASVDFSGTELPSGEPALQVGWDPLDPQWIQAGVIVTDLKTAVRQFPDLIEQYLFQMGAPEGLSKFVALHQALWNQGFFCYVPDGVVVDRPVKVWTSVTQDQVAVFPHTLLVVGKGSQVTVIEERRSNGIGTGPIVSDEMVEILLQPGAVLRYIHLQRWGRNVAELFTQRAVLERDAQFLNLTVGLGGRLTKANVETVLKEAGCRSDLLGVFFGQDEQHFDFHTLQDHLAVHTFSDLLYKSALKDRSKSIYTGMIRIRKGAQKSDAYQANRNLLLSEGAKADSIPMLEIEADDVRCTHGVATGPVDEEQAYYLMSRGMSPAEAERLIVEGFFEQVLQRIPLQDLKEQLLAEVIQRLSEVPHGAMG